MTGSGGLWLSSSPPCVPTAAGLGVISYLGLTGSHKLHLPTHISAARADQQQGRFCDPVPYIVSRLFQTQVTLGTLSWVYLGDNALVAVQGECAHVAGHSAPAPSCVSSSNSPSQDIPPPPPARLTRSSHASAQSLLPESAWSAPEGLQEKHEVSFISRVFHRVFCHVFLVTPLSISLVHNTPPPSSVTQM